MTLKHSIFVTFLVLGSIILTSNNQVHAENAVLTGVVETFPGKAKTNGQLNVENAELRRALDSTPGEKAQLSQGQVNVGPVIIKV